MNCDVAQFEKQFIVAAGLEGHCQLYLLRYKVITPKVENEGGIYSQVLEAYVFCRNTVPIQVFMHFVLVHSVHSTGGLMFYPITCFFIFL